MRTAKLRLGKNDYLLCFSTRVVRAVNERYGGVDKIDTVLRDGDTTKALDEILWLIHTMMDGGYRYAQYEGIDAPKIPTLDELQDICDVSDFSGLRDKINETISTGTPDVAVEDNSKNAGSTQAENP
mgnify:FL=1